MTRPGMIYGSDRRRERAKQQSGEKDFPLLWLLPKVRKELHLLNLDLMVGAGRWSIECMWYGESC